MIVGVVGDAVVLHRPDALFNLVGQLFRTLARLLGDVEGHVVVLADTKHRDHRGTGLLSKEILKRSDHKWPQVRE